MGILIVALFSIFLMDALLDAMRFREELDIRDRQRRRLLKAKTKVTAWLNRTQQQLPIIKKKECDILINNRGVPRQRQQHYSISTVTSEIPEIVVSGDDCGQNGGFLRPHTPAISLIYDFAVGNQNDEDEERHKFSVSSSMDIPISSSSSSLTSLNSRIIPKNNNRTLSLDTNTSANHKRVDVDDKSFSLDG